MFILDLLPYDLISTYIDFFIYSTFMQFFYFGVFSGVLFMFLRNNIPNRIEMFMGDKVGNILVIEKILKVKSGTFKKTYKGKDYYPDTTLSSMTMKHGPFQNPIVIHDKQYGYPVQGLLPDLMSIDTETNVTDEAISDSELSKKKYRPLQFKINPIWKASSEKIHSYFTGKMVETTWKAIIGQGLTANYLQLILGLAIGATVVLALYPQFVHPTIVQLPPTTSTVTVTSSR